MSYLPRSLSYTFHFCFDCAISISILGEMVVLQMIFLAIFSTQWYMSKAVYPLPPGETPPNCLTLYGGSPEQVC